jgi:integrase
LTALGIANLKPKDRPYEVPDGHGLFLTVRPNDSRSFNLRYRCAGKPRNLTIGPAAIGLAKAREMAREALVEIARGNDPAAAKSARKATERAATVAPADLIEKVVEGFIELYAKRETRDWRETLRLLDRNVVAAWRGRRLSEVTKGDVHTLLDALVDRGAPIGANRVFAQLRKMCAWAKSRGIIEQSPCEGIGKPSSEKGRARERVLDDRELALVWRAADATGHPFGPMVKLLALTGQRRAEVAEMEWREVDEQKALWTIPAARSKNRRTHAVPLAPAALAIIKELPRIASKETKAPVFCFTTTGESPVSGFSRAKICLDKAIANHEAELAPWTLHDIRRSVASGMAGLGIAPHVVEAVLNHKSGTVSGVAAVYNRYHYDDEKRAALETWAAHLDAITVRSV